MRTICIAVIFLTLMQTAFAQNWSILKKESKTQIEARKEKARKAEAKRVEKQIRDMTGSISAEEIEEYKQCVRANGWAYCIATDRYYWDEGKNSLADLINE